jgi:hypothetical protein
VALGVTKGNGRLHPLAFAGFFNVQTFSDDAGASIHPVGAVAFQLPERDEEFELKDWLLACCHAKL